METNVLIVEDDVVLQELYSIVLGRAGFVVTCTSNVTDAVQFVHSNSPDVIILDFDLSGFSGMQLLHDIRNIDISKQPRVLMLTAYAINMTEEETHLPDIFMDKPLANDRLISVVESLSRPA